MLLTQYDILSRVIQFHPQIYQLILFYNFGIHLLINSLTRLILFHILLKYSIGCVATENFQLPLLNFLTLL